MFIKIQKNKYPLKNLLNQFKNKLILWLHNFINQHYKLMLNLLIFKCYNN